MNTRTRITLTSSLTALALAIPTALALTTPAAPGAVDTAAEKAAWEALMAPTGEYAAAATYAGIVQKYGPVEPYVSILRSEQMHVQALARQLRRYGVTVPANPYLGQVPAPTSLKLGAQEEARGEVANVAMYDRLMPQASGDAQLTRVFTNLRAASQGMHLPLFQKAAAGNGTLSAAEMQAFHGAQGRSMNQAGQSGGMGQGHRMGGGLGGPGRMMGRNAADCPMNAAGTPTQTGQPRQGQPAQGQSTQGQPGRGPGGRR